MSDAEIQSYDQVIAIWDIQESLLQSYRNTFITSEAVIFGIAAFIAASSTPYLGYVLFPMAAALFIVWDRICRKRGLDVWFFQLQLLELESNGTLEPRLFTRFKDSRDLGDKERELSLRNDPLGEQLLGSYTRKVMENYLLWFFITLWLILGVIIGIVWAT